MATDADTHLLLRAFADELARCEVAGACTSPGSRSSPLMLALVAHDGIETWSHLDERVAGFFGLGLAKTTGRPAVLACTSGTAAAHYLPAVIEAHEAGVPLIVLTADRPPELRQVGAGQAIDQLKLYGDAVRWFFDVGTHDATPERGRWIRTLACRAAAVASGQTGGRPGPVHLNWALREPLIPPTALGDDPQPGRPDGQPWVRFDGPGSFALPDLHDAIAGRRGVIVAGRAADAAGAEIARLSQVLHWPLLADPLSDARTGRTAIAHYDALLRDAGLTDALGPEVVLRVGDLPTSKPLRQWLASLDVPQIAVGGPGGWADPDGRIGRVLPGGAVTALLDSAPVACDAAWLASWTSADQAAARAITATLGSDLSEPQIAAQLADRVPSEGTLVVASSMPVRDLETFAAARDAPPRILSNRGANGIDGTLATAFGVAAAHDGPVAVLLGDVAFAYDLSALICAKRHGQALAIVVLNNDGGGIFEFLPLSGIDRATFEEHVATPPGIDIADAARLYGCDHVLPADLPAFHAALDAALASDRTTIIEVRTERAANVALHREVWAAVSAAVSG
ncbi:2-succinyl-5-enolpyruvyl-6-hydroxy-3-cyclohexene-1-carboxylic-acid synthase [Svornostia abyssi]|uniref:2-succinyl-5-enolpyruvyl-6-hydroxy-3-cyclohexene-1-carboxylate synthase n=1 Tax=Svornostia abyssi TaxID=2898438 RepID=A0ABY5PC78_9ACTN|nr:2-succinyl-5-enolpyruvyl-6-hydroxy-3-cyclohexene-1-carboxylic-acid synthase [Parviterribacteraceae bacterium J379]